MEPRKRAGTEHVEGSPPRARQRQMMYGMLFHLHVLLLVPVCSHIGLRLEMCTLT